MSGAEQETLASKLYTRYVREVGGHAHDGSPLPSWREFRADPAKRVQSDAWVAVAQEADINLFDFRA